MTDKNIKKVLPNSKESEMMVLGTMLTSVNGLHIGADRLDTTDFYYSEHKSIFQILKTACKNDKPIDVHLACEELKRQDNLKNVGGAGYIVTLAQYAGTSAHVEEYAEILKRQRMFRDIIYAVQETEKGCFNPNENEDPLKTILDLRDKLNQIEKRKISNKFPMRFLNEFENNFLLTNPPKKAMLLEYSNENGILTGFLPKGIVAMLAGAGGVGKTHLLAQLAIAIATGTPWVETYTTTLQCGTGKKGNVFFGLGENQYDDIHRILHKASKHLRNPAPSLLGIDPLNDASKRISAFSFCGQQAAFIEAKKPSRYFYEFKMRLIEITPEGGWDLIILDPVSRLMGADAEMDNAAATQFIALLEELTIELVGNPTILFAHHVNKGAIKENSKKRENGGSSQADARGASALTDGVRLQLNLKKGEEANTAILEMTKTNFTAFAEKIILEKDQQGVLKKKTNSIENSKTVLNTQLNVRHFENENDEVSKLYG